MSPRKAAGPTDRVSEREPRVDQLAGRIDDKPTEIRRGVQAISTPREAVQAMLDAGAVFTVHRRTDGLGMNFTFCVQPGGDLDRARAVLAATKARPPSFLAAFKAHVSALSGGGS